MSGMTESDKIALEQWMRANVEYATDRPDVEETDPYHGVAVEDPESAKVFWTKVTEGPRAECAPEWTDHDLGWRAAMQPSDDGDRPTLDMGKVEPTAVGSTLVWDDDEPSVGDVDGYGRRG
jgi:hypothetical protein